MQLILGGLSSEYVIIQGNGSQALPYVLCESHEEADTRIFTHLAHYVQHYGYSHAVVQATDTDMLVMAFYHSVRIPGLEELWVQKGVTYIPFNRIARTLPEKNHLSVFSATSALRCGHVTSWCDTVSCPFRRGKKKAYKVVMSATQDITALTTYGDTGVSFSDEVNKSDLKLYSNFALFCVHSSKFF